MPFDSEQLRKTCVYECRGPVESMAAELSQIEGLAAQWHAARKRLLTIGIVSVVAGVLGLFVFAPVGGVLILLGIALFSRMKRYPKGVANGLLRCEFSEALAGILARDADPRAPAMLRLEFNAKQELL